MRHDSSFARPRRLVLLICTVAVLLALAGCSSSANGDGKPTIPPTGDTATPTVTPFIATPASIVGWRTYTDATYHFKTVIPPGWRIGTTSTVDSITGADCTYDVMYLPPGDTRTIEPLIWIGSHEYMRIEVSVKCSPPFDPPPPNWVPDGHVTISGVTTMLYKNDSRAALGRSASAEFGGHSYDFVLVGQATPDTAAVGDVSLYLGVLNGFAYLGGK